MCRNITISGAQAAIDVRGDRSGLVADPFGGRWFVPGRAEDVSAEEMQRRWNASAS